MVRGSPRRGELAARSAERASLTLVEHCYRAAAWMSPLRLFPRRLGSVSVEVAQFDRAGGSILSESPAKYAMH